MPKKRRKSSPLKRAKRKLWEIFSQYIRQRDKGVCFTCGLKKHWKEMQAGHFFTAANCGAELYFHEKNVHCQCYRCNINLGGNWATYQEKFVKLYGKELLEEFFRLKNQSILQRTEQDYLDLIAVYKEKIKKLK